MSTGSLIAERSRTLLSPAAEEERRTPQEKRRPPAPPLAPVFSSYMRAPKAPNSETFWVENPRSLFQSLHILPNCGMTDSERLNAMTRIVLIVTALLFLLKVGNWWLFFFLGIMMVVVLWYTTIPRTEPTRENFRVDREKRSQLPTLWRQSTSHIQRRPLLMKRQLISRSTQLPLYTITPRK